MVTLSIVLEIQSSLCKPGPDLIVCDEGHRIKNSQANTSQALKKVHTRYENFQNYRSELCNWPISFRQICTGELFRV